MRAETWRTVTSVAGGAVFAVLFLTTYGVLFRSGVLLGLVTRGLTVILLLWLAYAAWTRLRPSWRTGGSLIALAAAVIAVAGFLLDVAMAVDIELIWRGAKASYAPWTVTRLWRYWPLVGVAAHYVLRWIIPMIGCHRGFLKSALATVGLVISNIFALTFTGSSFVG